MKKTLIALLVLLCAGPSFADQVSKASHTMTSESGYIAARNLSRVMVGTTSSGGVCKIYNSTSAAGATVSTLISSFTMTVGNPLDFDNLNVKGIFYITTSNSNGITIIYKQ
jgi:hypothetical protein